ncbi:hypothetical protein NDU88_004296 [Pleurodeles waltl]|uniref:Secreted protein n=1 Tax=Pleurodeles waltl TaxID=8319 RepID=A0AAV7VIA0_PLEWA|nr:hypothetical protein NDU88_004296 [Pleurodeles waltl]
MRCIPTAAAPLCFVRCTTFPVLRLPGLPYRSSVPGVKAAGQDHKDCAAVEFPRCRVTVGSYAPALVFKRRGSGLPCP